MSTIGYGDIVPLTQLGRSLAMVFAFLGVSMFIALSGIILENRFRKIMQHHLFEYNKAIKKTQGEIQETQEDLEDIEKRVSKAEKEVKMVNIKFKILQKRYGVFRWSWIRLFNKTKK